MEGKPEPTPGEITSLSYETDANAASAAARSRYWRVIWIFAFGFSLVIFALTVTANALYRLSVARTLDRPPTLTRPVMEFDESDPIISAFVDKEACLPPVDDDANSEFFGDDAESETCGVLASLARGGAIEAAKEIQSAPLPGNGELLPEIKKILADQIEDSARRRDWATCGLMAGTALTTLDKQDSTPLLSRASDNRLLLLAGSCQFARRGFLAADDYAELTRRIATGAHLNAEYVAQAMQHPSSQLQAWGHYLDGIIQLRGRQAELAAAAFLRALDTKPTACCMRWPCWAWRGPCSGGTGSRRRHQAQTRSARS